MNCVSGWQEEINDIWMLKEHYGAIKLILEVSFPSGLRAVLLDVDWYGWVVQHPTQRLCKRVQMQYSATALDGGPPDAHFAYIHRREPWVLAESVDAQIFLGLDLSDTTEPPAYMQIFTLRSADYRAPNSVVENPARHKASILKKFERKLL